MARILGKALEQMQKRMLAEMTEVPVVSLPEAPEPVVEEKKKYTCEECGYSVGSKGLLKVHQNKEHNVEPQPVEEA